MKKYFKKQDIIADYLIITLGALMYSISVVVFIKPAHIPISGITGIAVIINYLFPKVSAGLLNALFNIPLILIGIRSFGRVFLVRTIYTVVVISVLIDYLPMIVPAYQGDILITLLFGGVIGGAGGGLVFLRGSTGGGLDIISKLLNRKMGTPIGTISMIINAFIILFSAMIYHNVESALYAVILTYVSSSVINSILIGTDLSNGAFIITEKPQEMADAIFQRLHRGVTAMQATGMYTHKDKTMLLCAVRKHEAIALKRIIGETDPSSFMLLSNVQEVMGKGFKNYLGDTGSKH
ncbi:MAG: YitT family protein [Clostridiales bacterium]|nr:YitT family protein [Clostridiales bacterium]